jgi:hypothetical protein
MTQNVNKITGPLFLIEFGGDTHLTIKRIIDVMEAAVRTFFSSPRFAVAGASQDQSKFGYRGEDTLQPKAMPLLNHGVCSARMVPRPRTASHAGKPSQSGDQAALSIISNSRVTGCPAISNANFSVNYHSSSNHEKGA